MPVGHSEHHVVIIPGFSVTPKKLRPLSQWCVKAGIVPHIFDFPVKEITVHHAALDLATFVDLNVLQTNEKEPRSCSVSFIACEYGTLVTRYFLSHYELPPARRCVLITDPWHPTDAYRNKKIGVIGKRRFGVPLTQIAEGPHGFASNCDCPPVPFGVLVTNTDAEKVKNPEKNKIILGSVFASPFLLRHAQDIQYVNKPCMRAVKNPEIHDYIGAFLTHGWFKEN